MRDPIKRGLKRLVLLQILLLALIMSVLYAALGLKAGYSALLGGLVCLIPSMLFALKLFRFNGAGQAKQIVRAFYVGEAWKLFLSMALFTVVFNYVSIDARTFFGSFIVMQLSHWLAPRFVKTR